MAASSSETGRTEASIERLSVENAALRRRIDTLKRQPQSISERLHSQLAAERATLAAVIGVTTGAVLVNDANGIIVLANPAARKRFSWAFEEPRPTIDALGLCLPDGGPLAREDLPMAVAAKTGQPVMNRELAITLPTGGRHYFLANTAPIIDTSDRVSAVASMFLDITVRRKAQADLEQQREVLEEQVEEKEGALVATVEVLQKEIRERERIERQLRQSEGALRRITQRTMETLESDRQLMAKELHDSIGASLAAIKFALEERIARLPEGGRREFTPVVGHLIGAIKETKRIAANLRPSILDDLGLLSTMKWYFREFEGLYRQITIRQKILAQENDIPETLKIVIYRTLQEAMNNAAKHGSPENIRVTLESAPDRIVLEVKDDGRGFDANDKRIIDDPMRGHGILGMRERAEISGGAFALSSTPGIGTRVRVSLPLREFPCNE